MTKLLLLSGLIVCSTVFAQSPLTAVQDDTVKAKECKVLPVINGKADDACWAEATWQSIDQVWITWGEHMDAADFTGRYKVCWSSETDRVYFLVEIFDDVLVKGYTFPDGGWPDWDVVEIFFDEDASGGDHTHNNNAYAYHITAGNDSKAYEVIDLQDGWNPYDFSDHLDCVINFENGVYMWEIGMIVYNDTYNPAKSNNSTEELNIGKVSGLSVAYCDNDGADENPKTRDNFIGSVAVPKANYNDHWMNADWFGKLKLCPATETSVLENAKNPESIVLEQNYPNPFNPTTSIAYFLPANAAVQLVIYNTLGQMIREMDHGLLPAGSHREQWDGLDKNGFPVKSGIYFYSIKVVTDSGILIRTKKMMVCR